MKLKGLRSILMLRGSDSSCLTLKGWPMTGKPKSVRNSFSFLRMGLKNKLIAIVIGVGTVPLILAMIFSYLQGNKSLTQVIGSSFQALAYETSTKIDLVLKEEIHKITHLAGHPTLVLWVTQQNKYLKQAPLSKIDEET
ncbi:MAG TPA: hypothetical protein VKA69_05250, partial [Desulfobacteria bacterium]|nr:hypothetical protein [Desulfobacteria bacterium]